MNQMQECPWFTKDLDLHTLECMFGDSSQKRICGLLLLEKQG